MDLGTFQRERRLNCQACEGLREQIRSLRKGRYVALGQGKIFAFSDTYGEAMELVQRLRPVPEYFLVFLAEDEPAFESYCG